MRRELKRIVNAALRGCGASRPVPACGLVWALGMTRRPRKRAGAVLRGRDIYYDERASTRRKHEMISECIALYVARRAGVEANRRELRWMAKQLTTLG